VQATCIPQGMITRCALTSYKATLLAAVTALQDQLREADGEPSVYVADNGINSESNTRQLNEAGVKWISRVSETLTQSQTVLRECPAPTSGSVLKMGTYSGFAGCWSCHKAQNAGIWAIAALPVKLMREPSWNVK